MVWIKIGTGKKKVGADKNKTNGIPKKKVRCWYKLDQKLSKISLGSSIDKINGKNKTRGLYRLN